MSVASGVESGGGEVEFIRLNDQQIQACQGCGGCEQDGSCVLNDDMTPLYKKLDEADAILLVSPIYFYGLTAQAKLFVDRCQALWSRRFILKETGLDLSRKGYFLATAATKGDKMFHCCMFSAKYFFDALGVSYEYEDSLLVNGVDTKGEIHKYPERLKEAFDFGCRF